MIYIECKADKALVMSLGVPKNNTNHEDKSRICSKFRKKKSNSLGMIDEDPNSYKPLYFDELNEKNNQHDIILYEDEVKHNHLIVLCPRLEEWIIRTCELEGINIVRKYNLPNNGHYLHKIINKNLTRFNKLLEELKTTERLQYLKHLIENLS